MKTVSFAPCNPANTMMFSTVDEPLCRRVVNALMSGRVPFRWHGVPEHDAPMAIYVESHNFDNAHSWLTDGGFDVEVSE